MSSTPDPTDPVVEVVLDADEVLDVASAESTVTETAEVADIVEDAEVVVPVDPDPQLLAAHDLALAALREITPDATVGDPAGYRVEADGVVSLRFANRLAGYPGWFWTVSLARVEDADPTVLEVELLPGDGALLAPDWVPWAVRLADYHAAQAALAEAAHADDAESDGEDEDDDHEDLEDVDDLDASDFDEDGSPILHAGDVDGVDIDEFAEAPVDDEHDDADDDDADDDDSDDDDFESDEDDDFDSDEDEDESVEDDDFEDSDEEDFDDEDDDDADGDDFDPEDA